MSPRSSSRIEPGLVRRRPPARRAARREPQAAGLLVEACAPVRRSSRSTAPAGSRPRSRRARGPSPGAARTSQAPFEVRVVLLEPGAPGRGIRCHHLLAVVERTHQRDALDDVGLGQVGLDRLVRQQVGDRVEHLVGPERVPLDLGGVADAGEHEHGVQARLDAGDDVGVHAVADHAGVLGVRADAVQRRPEHHRVRLADDVGLLADRLRDERRDRAGRGQHAVDRRAGRVGVRRDEPRAGRR